MNYDFAGERKVERQQIDAPMLHDSQPLEGDQRESNANPYDNPNIGQMVEHLFAANGIAGLFKVALLLICRVSVFPSCQQYTIVLPAAVTGDPA